jgi:hypothetical protein
MFGDAESGRADSSSKAVGWTGGHNGAVGERDRELAILAKGDVPSGVVDFVVMVHAHGKQVVEVAQPAVAPPDDVMDLATIETGGTAGDCAAAIQASQSAPLAFEPSHAVIALNRFHLTCTHRAELVDRGALRISEQRLGSLEQLRALVLVVELLGCLGQLVDVAGRDRTRNKRVTEPISVVQGAATLGGSGCGVGSDTIVASAAEAHQRSSLPDTNA